MSDNNVDRVRAAWREFNDALTGLRPIDLSWIHGLTEDERQQALDLFAATHAIQLDHRDRKVQLLAFLATAVPGIASVESAIACLTDEQLTEFNRIAAEGRDDGR